MALAVAATSEINEDPHDGSVVVTKPTGVSAGELLVIVATTTTEVPSVTSTGFTQSFAFGHDAGNYGRDTGFSFLWRVADASDVSATNYTVAGSVFSAYMFRITGWTSGEPVFAYSTIETILSTGNPTGISSGTIALDVPTEQIILFGAACGDEKYAVFTGPSVTPSNPSWTLLSNFDSTNSGNNRFYSSRVGYATRSQTTDITGFSFTIDQESGDTNTVIGFIACICTPFNATATNALFENDSEFFSPLTGSTQEPDNDFQEVSPEFFSQSGVARNPTGWANESKPTTSWDNET